ALERSEGSLSPDMQNGDGILRRRGCRRYTSGQSSAARPFQAGAGCVAGRSDSCLASRRVPANFLTRAIRNVHHVAGGGGVMTNLGVLGTFFARPDAIKEFRHVQGNCVRFVLVRRSLPL